VGDLGCHSEGAWRGERGKGEEERIQESVWCSIGIADEAESERLT
jgi:hypothetical protein